MDSFNIADAKAHLSELIERAAAGEEIEIKKRGEPIAKIVPVKKPLEPIDFEALKALTDKMKPSKITGVEIIRQMRDARY